MNLDPALLEILVCPQCRATLAVDDEAGELPKAFVTLKDGETVSEAELMAFVADSVASYKRIRLLEFIDEIPKSASGKILRRLLRDG